MSDQTVRDAIANFRAGEFNPADVAELVQFAESHLGDDDDEPVTYDDLIDAAAFTCEPFFTVAQSEGRCFMSIDDRIAIKSRGQLRALLKGLGR